MSAVSYHDPRSTRPCRASLAGAPPARCAGLWMADITYIPTRAKFLFLTVVADVFSRGVEGWAMAAPLWTELVLDALTSSAWQGKLHNAIHPSDQGAQYAFIASSSVPRPRPAWRSSSSWRGGTPATGATPSRLEALWSVNCRKRKTRNPQRSIEPM